MAKKENEYVAAQRKKYRADIDVLCNELPSYCAAFADAMLDIKQLRTILAYLQDLDVFLYFLKQYNPGLTDTPLKDIPVDIFDKLTKKDIHEFSKWLGDYDKYNRYTGVMEHHHNESVGKRRKMASLRTFYDYLVNDAELIANNPVIMTKLPKIVKKDIRTVEADELPRIMNVLQMELTRAQNNYEEKKGKGENTTRAYKEYAAIQRDIAIIYLFLGSGIRISELVGINLGDFKRDSGRINIIRKGGKEDHVFIGGDIEEKVVNYVDNYRPLFCPPDGNEEALFLSGHKKRITVRQIEQRVKRYLDLALGEHSGLSSHKFRATFATNYARATSDLKATAAVLGHESIATTSKYYTKASETAKLKAKEIDFLTIHE